MSSQTGNLTSVFWGFNRLSAVGVIDGLAPMKQKISVPATGDVPHRYEAVGSSMVSDLNVTINRDDLQMTLLTAWEAETAYPMVTAVRGTAGGSCSYVAACRLASNPQDQRVDEWMANQNNFAPGDSSLYRFEDNGLLFDHTMAHASGVGAPVNGTAVPVGAVSATQSITVFYANPHSPTPTVVGGVAKLQSASDQAFTIPNDRGTVFFTASSTPAYEVQTIAGAITDTWWRLSITAVTSGVYYPVCAVWIHTT